MKNNTFKTILFILIILLSYYLCLPPINITAISFWIFIIWILLLILLIYILPDIASFKHIVFKNTNKLFKIISSLIVGIIVLIILINIICSPLFNAKSYSKRISVNQSGDFSRDIEEVSFNSIPLLDRDSSMKLGDRVMGQMSGYVSQYYVSDQYTQINYNNDILRVTPLEYYDLVRWIMHDKDGINAYITVNSTTGEANLVKIDGGMKIMPSAYFNHDLNRVLRFRYPTKIFGNAKFEIDDNGIPYWVAPTISYTGISNKTKITGAVILNPVTGESKLYNLSEIPTWVDNVYYSSIVMEMLDDWGMYINGFFNSFIGQKNVVKTTDGYNYLALNNDIYLYTGITSVASDESNLGFVLCNLRTGETTYYSAPGAEEYSAMSSAEGQVQQMNYKSTFPLLINLAGKPTYLVSLKDQAGLVKMYGFVDVSDYQKVVVTDAKEGIKAAAQNYLKVCGTNENNNLLLTKEITIKSITNVVIDGTTYYYLLDNDNNKYRISIKNYSNMPYIKIGDTLNIGYYDNNSDIIEINNIN